MMEARRVLGRRPAVHRDVTGIIVNHIRVVQGHLSGGRTEARCIVGDVVRLGGGWTEARCIVGDVVRLPALLFHSSSSRKRTSDSWQVGEVMIQTSSSLPVGDVELDLDRICCRLVVRRNLDHDAGLRDRNTERL